MIRDTEPYERALFSQQQSTNSKEQTAQQRRQTTLANGSSDFGWQRKYTKVQPRKQSAVAMALGPEMLREIQESTGPASKLQTKRGVDVEVLLKGVEKLCSIYPMPGAAEKVASLRSRHHQISSSIAQYQDTVNKQQSRLNRMNRSSDFDRLDNADFDEGLLAEAKTAVFTEADLRLETSDIQELEQRKKDLEERVAGMEKDLGGLLR